MVVVVDVEVVVVVVGVVVIVGGASLSSLKSFFGVIVTCRLSPPILLLLQFLSNAKTKNSLFITFNSFSEMRIFFDSLKISNLSIPVPLATQNGG